MYIRRMKDDISKDEWNCRISKYSSKTIYHTYEWLEFIEESQGLQKIIYEIIINDKVVGYLPGFEIRKGPIKIFGSPFPGWTTPYMGPLINDNISQELFLKEFKNLMKREGYHYSELCNRNLNIEIAKKQGFIIEEGVTYVSEIKHTPDEILLSFSKSARQNVRRAIKNGLIVESTADESFIDYHYSMLKGVFKKSNMKPTYSKDRVRLLVEKLSPSNKITLTWVKHEGKIVASRIELIDGLWMNAFSTASDVNYLYLKPNELARFHAMCVATERGARYYDMTGGGAYKARFGSEKIVTHKIIYSRFGLYNARNLAKRVVKLKNKINLKLDSIKNSKS